VNKNPNYYKIKVYKNIFIGVTIKSIQRTKLLLKNIIIKLLMKKITNLIVLFVYIFFFIFLICYNTIKVAKFKIVVFYTIKLLTLIHLFTRLPNQLTAKYKSFSRGGI